MNRLFNFTLKVGKKTTRFRDGRRKTGRNSTSRGAKYKGLRVRCVAKLLDKYKSLFRDIISCPFIYNTCVQSV